MIFPRLQLFELNDTPVVPRFVRDTIIESLSRTLAWGRILRGVVAPFDEFMRRTNATEVLDIGAGAGGPAAIFIDELLAAGVEPPRFILTDIQPQVESWRALKQRHPRYIDYVAEPVDGTAIPPELARGRVTAIINVLHHFPPHIASSVLNASLERSAGLFAIECFERTPLGFAPFAPAGTFALLANPVLCPRDRLKKAVFTWLTPLAVASAIWDGIVSTLRVYSEAELRAMLADFKQPTELAYGTFPIGRLGHGYHFSAKI